VEKVKKPVEVIQEVVQEVEKPVEEAKATSIRLSK
jgi:hypothetical protein